MGRFPGQNLIEMAVTGFPITMQNIIKKPGNCHHFVPSTIILIFTRNHFRDNDSLKKNLNDSL